MTRDDDFDDDIYTRGIGHEVPAPIIPRSVERIVVTEFTDQALVGICISLKDGRMVGTICGLDDWAIRLSQLIDEIRQVEPGEAALEE